MHQKRETDGKYAFDGNLDRLCVCGHDLGAHSAGSPADCLFYSLPACERAGKPGEHNHECGCQKFRESRKRNKGGLVKLGKSANGYDFPLYGEQLLSWSPGAHFTLADQQEGYPAWR